MIWIIGGTKNAIDICRIMAAKRWPVVVSVTTDYGRRLAELNGVEVIRGKLNEIEMAGLIASKGVKLIVDASHPFAAEVSQNAIKTAQHLGVPYIRFERLNQEFTAAKYVSDYGGAIDYLRGTNGNILLTTGSKNIAKFVQLGVERLYARVLSSSESICQCEHEGLEPTHIIGVSGVCSVGFNVALIKQFNIKYLVTKESGPEGGVREKVKASRLTGVDVVIIKRPIVHYPAMYSDYDTIIGRTEEIIN